MRVTCSHIDRYLSMETPFSIVNGRFPNEYALPHEQGCVGMLSGRGIHQHSPLPPSDVTAPPSFAAGPKQRRAEEGVFVVLTTDVG